MACVCPNCGYTCDCGETQCPMCEAVIREEVSHSDRAEAD